MAQSTLDKATVAHLMTSVSRGGLELYVRELIVHLNAAGLRQVVVCHRHAFMVQELKALGIPVEFLPSGSRYSPLRMAALRAIDKRYRVHIWHSHQRDDMVLVALAFFFRKSIRHIFSLYMGFAHKKDLLHRMLYRRVEKLVTTSELMNSLALERLPVTKAQIACIRYGRDDKAFRHKPMQVRSLRQDLGIGPKQKMVLSLCRIDPMKGVREFAAAAALVERKLPGKYVFVQVGERTISSYSKEGNPIYLPESEDCYRELLALAQNESGKKKAYFRLLPFQQQYQKYLCAADYFVLASYDEMYSLSLVDAMLAGCLVIGTNNGGTVEQLSEQRGFLIEAKSAEAIAAAIIHADKNPREKNRMRQAAQEWAKREHTWGQVLPQWLKLYGVSA